MQQESIISKIQFCIENTSAKSHFHNEYEVIFVTEGKIEIIINDKTYLAEKGSIIFISNHEQHSIKVLSEPYKRYYAIIYPKIADKLINNPLLISILKNRPVCFKHCMDISNNIEYVSSLLDKLINENDCEKQLQNELMACYLEELLILVLRSNQDAFPAVQNTNETEIYEIQKYLDKNFTKEIKIADIADKFYISLYYLSHCFKKQTGYSPKQYLLLIRLSYARELLINTDTSITEITEQCGFSDVNNFIRIFKREYTMTPKQYRQLR